MTVVVTGDPLTPADVVAVARRRATARLGDGVAARMEASRRVIAEAVAGDRVVYGVTTGFGALSNTRVDPDLSAEM